MLQSKSPAIRLKTAWEIAFSPVEDRIAYFGGRDVTVLNLRTGKPLFAVHPIANPSHIDFSPDGRRLVVKGTSGRTIILDAKNGRLLSDFRNQKEGEGEGAFFSSCGRFVVSVSWAGLFSVREWASTEMVFSQVHSGCQVRGLSVTADRHSFVYALVYAPPLDSPLAPYTIVRQQWPTQVPMAQELSKRWKGIYGSQISPSGRLLAVVHGTPPETFEVYDLKRSCPTAEHDGEFGGIGGCSIGWSSDEKTLAIVCGDKCKVLAMPTLVVKHEIPMQYPCFVRFSPSYRFLALGSAKESFIVPTDYLATLAASRRKNA